MASQAPKFQYNPSILDISRAMPNINRDLAQEQDGIIFQEVGTAINMLAQHDRQLEDYLTNLSPGGGLKFIIYELATASAQVYTAGVGGFPGVTDAYTITYSNPISIFQSIIPPSGFGIAQIQGTIQWDTSASTDNVQLFLVESSGAGILQMNEPWAQNSTATQSFTFTQGAAIFSPTDIVVTLVAVQPNGAPQLGAGGITIAPDSIVLLEFS